MYVAIAAGAFALSNVVVVLAFLRVLRGRDREWGRRFDLVVNQLLHATNHTWTPPPADEWTPADDEELGRFVTSPEQLPE